MGSLVWCGVISGQVRVINDFDLFLQISHIGGVGLHPLLGRNAFEPVMDGRNVSRKIFHDMLLPNHTDGNQLEIRVSNAFSKDSLSFENALGVMTKSTMTECRFMLFSFIKPLVNVKIISWFASELPSRGFGVINWMCHQKVHPSADCSIVSFQ